MSSASMNRRRTATLRRIVTRRRFLQSSSAAAFAATFVPSRAFGANDRVRLAAIGVGGKGATDIQDLSRAGAEIVALCDVTESPPKKGRQVRKLFARAPFYQDFRRMLDKEGSRTDGVSVSTPDHTHFVAAFSAIERGKHVYCQKPLTHSIWEARQLAEATRRFGVATQMGNQGHASEPVRRGVEWLRGGVIGKVQEVHAWTNRPIWPQGMTERPPKQEVPADLDWDLWLGPAPQRDYNEAYCPFRWRGWWDFGTGALGDMGCHILDLPYWALELGYPTEVAADAIGNTDEAGPTEATVTYTFPAGKYHGDLKLKWYDGNRLPPREATSGAFVTDADGSRREMTDKEVQRQFHVIFVGEKGKLFFDRRGVNTWQTSPKQLLEDFEPPAQSIPRVSSEDVEWLTACRGGAPTLSNFTFSGPFTEVVLLGNLAIRVGKPIKWNGPAMRAENAPEAAPLIRREYRKGWRIGKLS